MGVLLALYTSFMVKLTAFFMISKIMLLSTWSLDLYESQLWNYGSIEVLSFM